MASCSHAARRERSLSSPCGSSCTCQRSIGFEVLVRLTLNPMHGVVSPMQLVPSAFAANGHAWTTQ